MRRLPRGNGPRSTVPADRRGFRSAAKKNSHAAPMRFAVHLVPPPTNTSWSPPLLSDAEALPVLARSVDAYTIAFGLRNVTRIDTALTEAHRVLRPGGRFLCLEFSRVVDQVLAGLYERFSFSILPALGRTVAADASAYRYLAESIQQFPPQEELATRIQAAGFERVSHRNMTRGVVAIHGGWRI